MYSTNIHYHIYSSYALYNTEKNFNKTLLLLNCKIAGLFSRLKAVGRFNMSGSMDCFYIIKRRRRMPNSTRFQTKLTLFVSFRQLIVKYKVKNSGIAGPNRLCFLGKLLRYLAVVLS